MMKTSIIKRLDGESKHSCRRTERGCLGLKATCVVADAEVHSGAARLNSLWGLVGCDGRRRYRPQECLLLRSKKLGGTAKVHFRPDMGGKCFFIAKQTHSPPRARQTRTRGYGGEKGSVHSDEKSLAPLSLATVRPPENDAGNSLLQSTVKESLS